MHLLRTGREAGGKLPPPGRERLKEIHGENPNNPFSTPEPTVI